MLQLLDLPEELLLLVISHATWNEIESLGWTCSKMNRICQQQLPLSFRLRKTDCWLEKERNKDIGWHDILLEVLRGSKPVENVMSVDIDDSRETHTASLKDPSNLALLRTAIRGEHWLNDAEKAVAERELHYIADGRHSMDGVITTLLLRLPNIHSLNMPAAPRGGTDMKILRDVVARIAIEADRRKTAGLGATIKDLPFCGLESVNPISCGEYGIGLLDLAPFLALPNIHDVELWNSHEDDFEWPAHLPKSRIPSMVLQDSSVSLRAVRGLARGMVGPWSIYMSWGERPEGGFGETYGDWDDFSIPRAGAGEAEWVSAAVNVTFVD